MGAQKFALSAGGALVATLGCGAYNEARQVDGQTYYVQQRVDLGERAAYAATHDCGGGVRDDDAALKLVQTTDECRRSEFVVSYVVDGIHRIDACNERWRVRCNKTPSTRGPAQSPPPMTQGPLDCEVYCLVEDHYRASP